MDALKPGFQRWQKQLTEKGERVWSRARALLKTGMPERFWLWFLVVGFLLGLGAKAFAVNHITIGYDDYRLVPAKQLYDLNAIQDAVLSEGGTLTQPQPEKNYSSCPADEETF